MNNPIPLSRLIIFTRFPEPGKTKTRLIPALGPKGAADLQRQMTEQTLIWVRRLAAESTVALEVRFEGGNKRGFQKWLGQGLHFVPQGIGNLGKRMARAFQEAFQEGAGFVVLIGSDCPGLSPSIGSEAFAALEGHDVVLGPANDGGYYLIGLRQMVPQLFDAIPWGTEIVFSKTLDIAKGLGLRMHCLVPLDDVDRPEDLPVWGKNRDGG
jgi:uncharacterized protein